MKFISDLRNQNIELELSPNEVQEVLLALSFHKQHLKKKETTWPNEYSETNKKIRNVESVYKKIYQSFLFNPRVKDES